MLDLHPHRYIMARRRAERRLRIAALLLAVIVACLGLVAALLVREIFG